MGKRESTPNAQACKQKLCCTCAEAASICSFAFTASSNSAVMPAMTSSLPLLLALDAAWLVDALNDVTFLQFAVFVSA
jgi:dihydroxyacid dehydratase/phosphogluconate dehydratase